MSHFPLPPPWARELVSIGVTGTNGKTTTTSWIAAALAEPESPVACISTVGSRVGDRQFGLSRDYEHCLQVLSACREAGGRFAVLELTSAALGAGFLRGWPCQVGVFTNLSLDHLDAHGSAEHYLASKAQLFVSLPSSGAAVLNACDPNATLLDEVTPSSVARYVYAVPSRGKQVVEPNLSATAVSVSREGTRAEISSRGLPREWPRSLSLSAVGEAYVENALAALLAAAAVGAAPVVAARKIEATRPPPGRFEIVNQEPLVVVDYAHSPDALRRTLSAARAIAAGEIWLVLGAGGGPTKSKRAPLGEAARLADRVILTSDNPRDEDPAAIAQDLLAGLGDHPRVSIELGRRSAIEGALAGARRDDLVLIAGKGHESEQVVRGVSTQFSDGEVVRAWCAGPAEQSSR